MKKVLSVVALALFSVVLVACGNKEYKVDGEFTAFEVSLNYGTPMITWADVVIEDGEVKSITLDALQGQKADDKFTWNEKTKKELGYGYRMHGPSMSDEEYKKHLEDNNLLEWFEQAKLIEEHYLADLNAKLTSTNDVIDNVTGVTIKDGGYSTVIAAALENARNNKFVSFETGTSSNQAQVVWVEVTTNNKGKVTEVFLDTLQSKDFTWNEKTKKELGYGYRMHGPGMEENQYLKLLEDEGKLEWFEQAELIEAKFLESLSTNLDGETNVTIVTTSYENVFKAALKLIK